MKQALGIPILLLFCSVNREVLAWDPFSKEDWEKVGKDIKGAFEKVDEALTGAAKALYEKGLKPAYEKGIGPVLKVSGDLIDIATKGGSCPDVTVTCLTGYGEKEGTSCGTFKMGQDFGIKSGCKVSAQEITGRCNILCNKKFGTPSTNYIVQPKRGRWESLTESVQTLVSGDLCKKPATAACYVGYDEGRQCCGTVQVSKQYGGISEACVPDANDAEKKCNEKCQTELKLDADEVVFEERCAPPKVKPISTKRKPAASKTPTQPAKKKTLVQQA